MGVNVLSELIGLAKLSSLHILYKNTVRHRRPIMTTQQHYRQHIKPASHTMPAWLQRIWGWL